MKTPENAADSNVVSKTPEEIMYFLCKLRLAASEADDLLTTWSTRDLHDVLEVSRDFMFEAADLINQFKTRLAQAERERDAAVNELNESRYCWHCKHSRGSARKEPCRSCDLVLKNNYEWRGVCSENTKEE